ncbi:MAG: MlaC/ttg2D family ABC transporter substrate-binding protein [Alphaproteobacteria bacterium]
MTRQVALSITRRGFSRGLAVLGTVALVSLGAPRPADAAESGDPAAFVHEFSVQAIGVLADHSLSGAHRQQAFRDLLTAGFDVKAISRFVLGRYWRKATEAQRAEFMGLFEDLIVATYSTRFSDYSGQTLKVEAIRVENEKMAAVASRILRQGGEPIRIDWRLLRRGESWRIVDVVVEGMSMVLSQRSEYAAVIKGDGGKIEGLLVRLREKTARLGSASVQKADSTQ